MRDNIVNVCLALHDATGDYSKHTAVTIFSLLSNTASPVCIYLLHDKTVSGDTLHQFCEMVKSFNQEFEAIEVEVDIPSDNSSIKFFTPGTLFRLKMAEVLPSISKVIYLDSDIVVNLDILELWQLDLGDKLLACRQYGEESYWMISEGYVDLHEYFNVGVLLFDLDKVREKHDFYEEAMMFFKTWPNCTFLDNDAMNYIFKKQVMYFDEKFNAFTVHLRKENRHIDKAVFHYAGDYVNYWNPQNYDIMYISYLASSGWQNGKALWNIFKKIAEKRNFRDYAYRKLLFEARDKKIIVFGSTGELYQKVIPFVLLDENKDFIVDNHWEKRPRYINGIAVNSPDILKSIECKDEYLIIVMSKRFCGEIRHQIYGYGFVENQVINGLDILSEDEGNFYKI